MSVEFENFEKTITKKKKLLKKNFDTIVVPAHDWGVDDVFLKEHRWYSLKLSTKSIPKLKFLALYEIRRKSIRYIAKIKKIEPYENTGKYQIFFKEKPMRIEPIRRSKKFPHLAPQNKIYTKFEYFSNSIFLEDVFLRTD